MVNINAFVATSFNQLTQTQFIIVHIILKPGKDLNTKIHFKKDKYIYYSLSEMMKKTVEKNFLPKLGADPRNLFQVIHLYHFI